MQEDHTSASAMMTVTICLKSPQRFPLRCESSIFFDTGTFKGFLSPDGILIMLERPPVSLALMKMS